MLRRLREPGLWLTVAAALLPACQTVSPPPQGSYTVREDLPPVFRPAEEYLTYMHMLAVAPPDTQKDLYQQATRIYREQQTPHAKLKFALALGILDAPYGDATKASRHYRELLPPNESPPSDIESLLLIRLSEAKHRLMLEERMALLQQSLDKAEAKIQALTTIEKTLEQPIPETRKVPVP